MRSIVKQLKALGAKVCPEGTVITGNTASEVIHCITTEYERGTSSTKLSELTNDVGFITAEDIPTIPEVPSVPEEDGEYKLVVADGVATWTKITG